ncbi:hypothetical protein [Streptomyces sp. NPDC051636]|uniref:hypothetical protein n=1 Tax=Streptomyces sp. NPDC051636 TaxID=3365663 RepID=UPI0037AA40F9
MRQLTGEGLDGARLVDAVLMPGQGNRNPAAHEPRLHRTIIDEELLELLTALSMVHRRLDGARVTR